MRRNILSWNETLTKLGFRRIFRKQPKRCAHSRRLKIEGLEPRQMLSITVNTLVDEIDGINAGGVSLRDAIAYEATQSGPHTISFDPALVDGVIELTHGQLSIGSSVTIEGLGEGHLTIDAQGNSRVIGIASGSSVAIRDLTITGGQVPMGSLGAGILSYGNLELQNVAIVDNHVVDGSYGSGGGVFSMSGSLTIIDSTIENNSAHWAGGVDVRLGTGCSLIISGSTVAGNSGWSGGGIHIEGGSGNQVKIANSTFSGNTSGWGGGGLYLTPTTAQVTITNCTIANNTANAGGGGGIMSQAPMRLDNTIVAQNHAPTVSNGITYHIHDDLYGTFATTSSYNFLGNAGWSGLTTANHNLGGFNLERVFKLPDCIKNATTPSSWFPGQGRRSRSDVEQEVSQ